MTDSVHGTSPTEQMAWFFADGIRSEVEDAMFEATDAMQKGEPLTEEHIQDLRRAKDRLQWLTEDFLAKEADGVEAWEKGAGQMVPYSVMREQLESSGHAPSTTD